MRVVFMGTPQIAADCLSRLIADGFDLVGVYTKPDMPKNRGMKLAMSEVKEVALAAGLPVYQPATFRDDAAVEELRALRPDVIAVVAYGKILPQRDVYKRQDGCRCTHRHGLSRRPAGQGRQRAVAEPVCDKLCGFRSCNDPYPAV